MIITSRLCEYRTCGEFFSPSELFDREPYAPRERLIHGSIVEVADEVRRRWGGPIPCTAGVRTQGKQELLRQRGYRAAQYSPHVYRCAMDLDVPAAGDVRRLVAIVREVSRELGIPVRIGWRQYLNAGQSFVHVDTAPVLARDLNVHPDYGIAGLEW